ncbi:TPA: hypothetical protein NOE54_001019 [Pseudomonas aeruginosa]|uniref:hypothetical protein n=1 Tax=Pseudomonas aeruginosa TaxID=287 RepID=UPI0013F3D0EC|nr:hypothetical protein [Pseudomonas aeruginosa]MBG7278087.1 hypothetical protein [Pseudomonas aeruginosa]MBY9100796.1 hypothetical protein [Pseudomonas aeruginosa]MBY9140195.1 hypothetical protein [Pseudomonas aeruginosa]MBY9210444.1 hypothetical protein [Pseudomonas aeruginosa]MBY9610796.1 hypothetical protein [Pseudomonas aeruginosa]
MTELLSILADIASIISAVCSLGILRVAISLRSTLNAGDGSKQATQQVKGDRNKQTIGQ